MCFKGEGVLKREAFRERIRHPQMWVWDSQETVNLKMSWR